MIIDNSGYHNTSFSPKRLKRCVARVARNLKKLQKKVPFDAIAFRGVSGAAIAFPVSALTGLHLICVRKERNSHGNRVEGPSRSIKRYVILDDFISSGETIRAIYGAVKAVSRSESKCVGICLYAGSYGSFKVAKLRGDNIFVEAYRV